MQHALLFRKHDVRTVIVLAHFHFYLINPVIEGRHTGEDGGLLNVVAAQARHEAGNAVDLPTAVSILAVQGAARVTLCQNRIKVVSREHQGLQTHTLLDSSQTCCVFLI